MHSPVSGNSWLIKGGRIIDPARKIDRIDDLAVRDGVIAESVGETEVRVLDAEGLIVAPGLIDMHVHLREPGGEHKETIATGTAAAVAGGFTTVACMPNTTPPPDSPERVAWIGERARTTGACRVRPIAALTLGRKGRELVDFAALQRAGAAAFSDDGDGLADDRLMEDALQRVRMVGSVLIQHCEDKRLAAGGVMHAGPAAERLGLPGLGPQAEETMIQRDIELVRRTGARYHVAHVSTARAVDLVRRAKANGLPVTAEVCPHHLTLHDRDVLESGADPNFKMCPPLRSERHVRACVAGLLDGTIDCVVTDHAPHTREDKSAGFAEAPFGIVGLETALALVHRVLSASEPQPVQGTSSTSVCAASRTSAWSGMVWTTLVNLMSTAPARVMGWVAPSLAPDQPADITIIDPEARWTVDADHFASKSRNTPYDGWSITGRAAATLVAGQVRHLHDAARARLG